MSQIAEKHVRPAKVRWLTRAEAREALAMDERRFSRAVARHMPRQGEGSAAKYPWPDVLFWLLEDAERRGRESVTSGSAENDAKKRHAAAKATRAEIELAQLQGELMTVADGEAILNAICTRIRGRLMAWPGKLAARLAGLQTPAQAQEIMRLAVTEVLSDLQTAGKDLDRELAA